MTRSLLIYNDRSGSCDPAVLAEVEQLFADAGRPIGDKHGLGDGPLPDAASAADLDLIIVLSGDGSLSAVADSLAGWNGSLLVLPGGTMNLLARALHGDLAVADIVKAYLDGQGAPLHTPVIRAEGDITAYTGMIVGPTAAWADVREDMRNLDVAGLATNVPRALAATLSEPGVGVAGREGDYPAILIEPSLAGLRAVGVLAGSAGELFRHGWAWVQGDFRNGPSEPLGTMETMRLETSAASLAVLADGEKADAGNPLELRTGRSDVRFHALQGETAWR